MSASLLVKSRDYGSSPQEADIRSLLGGLLSGDWRQALIARGFGWHCDIGAFSTPIQGGGAGTIFDQDQPELAIGVPSGYTFVPLRVDLVAQPPLMAADSDEIEILIAADRLAEAAAITANGTVEVPSNMRSSAASGCPLTVVSACTGNITNPTLGVELAHAVKVAELGSDVGRTWTDLKLLYQPKWPPFLVGPAGFYCYWGGTVATSGFGNLDFLAIPSTLLTGLS